MIIQQPDDGQRTFLVSPIGGNTLPPNVKATTITYSSVKDGSIILMKAPEGGIILWQSASSSVSRMDAKSVFWISRLQEALGSPTLTLHEEAAGAHSVRVFHRNLWGLCLLDCPQDEDPGTSLGRFHLVREVTGDPDFSMPVLAGLDPVQAKGFIERAYAV